jgi:hypothetical protein
VNGVGIPVPPINAMTKRPNNVPAQTTAPILRATGAGVCGRISTFVIACCTATLASAANASLDAQTEGLIDRLPQVSKVGYGYSALFSGSQFLPEPDSAQIQSLILGSQAPTNSAILESIVRRGVVAVPSLLKHLDDARRTKIPPLSGMMWMSFDDEYDYNRRLRKGAPTGVNRDTFGQNHPTNHTVTVGDLCFVALGQIVNRSFDATRYQPTGGLVISSPTYSSRLCAVVRRDFEGLSEKKHRDLLVRDFLEPDFEERRNGACRRIAFYYPEAIEPLVLKQLLVPTYDVFKINDFVRGELYPNKVPKKGKAMFDESLRLNGPAFSNGVLLQLFGDLYIQEADEQHNLSPPLKEKYDARALLVQLFGYSKAVNSTNKPYVNTWAATEQARFIKVLKHYRSRRIDETVQRILAETVDDDYLALACMDRLSNQGYDEEIRRYCERRIPNSKHHASELQKMINHLDSRKSKTPRPDGAVNGSEPIRSEINRSPSLSGPPR